MKNYKNLKLDSKEEIGEKKYWLLLEDLQRREKPFSRDDFIEISKKFTFGKKESKSFLKKLILTKAVKTGKKGYYINKKYTFFKTFVKPSDAGNRRKINKTIILYRGRELQLKTLWNAYFCEGDEIVAIVRKSKKRDSKTCTYICHTSRRKYILIGELERFDGRLWVRDFETQGILPLNLEKEKRGGKKKFKKGEVIKGEIKDGYSGTYVKFIEQIGERGDLNTEVMITFLKNKAPLNHREETKEYAEEILHKGYIKDNKRVDLRRLPFFTLDTDEAKDHDDAIFVEKNKRGFKLYVAISDVSEAIRVGTPIDDEALIRGFSVYWPGGFSPMLPEKLTKEYLSLIPGEDRNVLVVEAEINFKGNVKTYSIYPAVICSRRKLFYTEVTRFLEKGEEIPFQFKGTLENMNELANILREKRKNLGSLDFELYEQSFIFSEEGLEGIRRSSELAASRIVEEFMIVANSLVAEFTESRKQPSIYRIHPKPGKLNIRILKKELSAFNVKIKKGDRYELNRVLKSVKNTPLEKPVIMKILRSMKLAVYSPLNTGHYGLALDYYTHFTSPIRRYPDIVVHRAVKNALGISKEKLVPDNLNLGEVAERCSFLERRADQIEREIEKFLSAFYVKKIEGEIRGGIVSGIIPSGIFVELDEPYVEGFVPRKWIRKGKELVPGDRVRVKIVRVDTKKRMIDFKLLPPTG